MNFQKTKQGFRLFGLDKQDCIKYFFGGNASVAVFILVLIVFFLLKEGWSFLPNHHEQLKTYRRSGLEYFTEIENSYQQYKVEVNALNQAFAAEYGYPNQANQDLLAAYEATGDEAKRILGKELLLLKDAKAQLKNVYPKDGPKAAMLQKVIDRSNANIDARRDELKKLLPKEVDELKSSIFKKGIPKEERDKIVETIAAQRFDEKDDSEYLAALEEKIEAVEDEVWDHAARISQPYQLIKNKIPKPLDKVWKEASNHAKKTRDRIVSHLSIAKQVEGQVKAALVERNAENLQVQQQRFGEVLGIIANAEFFNGYGRIFYLERFSQKIKGLNESGSYYQSLPGKIRKASEGFLDDVDGNGEKFLQLLKGNSADDLVKFVKEIPEDEMIQEQRDALIQLVQLSPIKNESIKEYAKTCALFADDFPYAKEAEVIYALTDRYHQAVETIETEGKAAIATLPELSELKSPVAVAELKKFEKVFDKNLKRLKKSGKKLDKWQHDKSWSFSQTLSAFFLGKTWTNNSEIQDRYGILPLFFGSLVIAIIALCIAVPLSVAGAIYVNQIAGFREQSFVKPAIEFIGAIPSVVLGFLGIVVVSTLLQGFSENPLLSWLPGFPIENRLNMLVAGLLLGFMACPIIFTLAEDALNNVPTAYRDGSLSMGASRLQTAFRVVLPAAGSGVFAAVLLGFGRVIGETMVVLLVAGNRAKVPDFTAGIGVVTQPAHTMTGMPAQGLGEAAKNSVDWWALFMVGAVLFFITLTINFIGQKILNKFEVK